MVWDGAAFGQRNPQKTSSSGTFNLFLPAGKYYLQATAPGYHTLISNIIDANQPTPVTADLLLHQMHGPHLAGHYLTTPSLAVQRGIQAAAICITRLGAQASIPFLHELAAP